MKYLKLFENFESGDEEYDIDSYEGCGCCPVCTGEKDCECGCPECNCPEDLEDDDDDFIDEESNIDLSIELENKLRSLSDDSKMTVDDFLSEFGVDPEYMTDFAWASILKNAEKYKEMSDEEFSKLYDEYKGSLNESKDSGVTASLRKKAKASGIPMGILRKVFSKGMQAWNAGHRPGVAQHQWGMGRVNSFITGAGGARKADADLWAKAKAAKARKKKK